MRNDIDDGRPMCEIGRAPVVPLYTRRLPDLTSRWVGNYQASPFGYPLFDQMWVR